MVEDYLSAFNEISHAVLSNIVNMLDNNVRCLLTHFVLNVLGASQYIMFEENYLTISMIFIISCLAIIINNDISVILIMSYA